MANKNQLFIMRDYHTPFEDRCFYHIYNRAIGKEVLFKEEKNYNFFLRKWNKYLDNYFDIWAYCLISNHFHFLIRVKSNIELTGFENLSALISQKLSNFFNSYTKSFNKVYNRHGGLFQRPFKRVKVDSRDYLQHLIHYIHHNPIHHGFVKDYIDWRYSSYTAITSSYSTEVDREKVLKLFGGREKFIAYHIEMKNYNRIEHFTIE